MGHFVSQPVGTVGECLLAIPTREWPLAGMNPLVVHQFRFHPEGFLADVTLEGQFALVLQHVRLQTVPLHIRLATNVAHELPGSRVTFDVRFQLIAVDVRFGALVTFELLFHDKVVYFVALAFADHSKLEATN